MEFIGHQLTQTVFLEAEDGKSYRTDPLGNYWECLYGESWESIWGSEETRCKAAYMAYLSTHQLQDD